MDPHCPTLPFPPKVPQYITFFIISIIVVIIVTIIIIIIIITTIIIIITVNIISIITIIIFHTITITIIIIITIIIVIIITLLLFLLLLLLLLLLFTISIFYYYYCIYRNTQIYFNRWAADALKSRRVALGNFMSQALVYCNEFDTPQQDMLFRYLRQNICVCVDMFWSEMFNLLLWLHQ